MGSVPKNETSYPIPLKSTGALDKFEFADATPSIGREYPKVNIVDDLLNAPNADELVRELGIAIAQRGVVFFRKQDNLTNDLQKQLIQRLGELTGKPAEASLHIHPILNDTSEFGVGDAQISTISSTHRKKLQDGDKQKKSINTFTWHSDIQFEHNPPDFSSLRLTQLPSNGGDTLWASGYDIYDKFSKPYQQLLEGLTATYIASGFLFHKDNVHEGPRGHPANVGREFSAVHPVVRTNPVTGWKSIYAIGPFPKYINELTDKESDNLLKTFREMITENHDLQVRFKWHNENDIAIWDNRSAFHTPTYDYDDLGDRGGNRAVSIAEKPFFDPNSKSRADSLASKQ